VRPASQGLAVIILSGAVTGYPDGPTLAGQLERGVEVQTYVTNPQVIHETIDGETIVIDLASGTYYSLRGAAPTIWNALTEGESEDHIVDRLGSVYNAETAEIEPAVAAFLSDLIREQLIAPGEAARAVDSAGPPPAAGDRAPFVTPKIERFTDMQEIILLDPVHKVDSEGWPHAAPSVTESA
jgi:hypothetical protein